MVDLDWNAKMVSPDMSNTKSPKLSNMLRVSVPASVRAADIPPTSSSACSTYEHYLRLPELRKLWTSREFPEWKNEPLLKPTLQALEITFRFVSTVLSDLRPYTNQREWRRRLESHDEPNPVHRVEERIESKRFDQAAHDCYLLEQIWNLLAEIEDLHLLMDPDDFLQLKNQLAIRSVHDSELFCFRSKGLVEIARRSKDLKHKVPEILGVEVDPKGGPRIHEAAIKLYRGEKSGGFEKIHLLNEV